MKELLLSILLCNKYECDECKIPWNIFSYLTTEYHLLKQDINEHLFLSTFIENFTLYYPVIPDHTCVIWTHNITKVTKITDYRNPMKYKTIKEGYILSVAHPSNLSSLHRFVKALHTLKDSQAMWSPSTNFL